jgi:uncharacterized membrane protein
LENFLHITFVWVHILGIALFVGPQFFLAFAWLPASRGIEDLPTRVRAMRTITTRFGYVGGVGLAMIIIAGSYLIATWRSYYGLPDEVGFNSLRFGVVFSIKMVVLLVMLVFTGLHMFLTGPQQLARMEALAAGEDVPDKELRMLRKHSMLLSMSALTLTLVIMVLGVMLTSTKFSLQDF